jgi:hypothetical protein
MDTQTVTAIQVTTTDDGLGNTTTTQTEQTVSGVLFEPRQATERTDSRSPGVVTPAKFYLPIGLELDADDVIVDAAGVWWQVVGGSSVWGQDTEVPVTRASGV